MVFEFAAKIERFVGKEGHQIIITNINDAVAFLVSHVTSVRDR